MGYQLASLVLGTLLCRLVCMIDLLGLQAALPVGCRASGALMSAPYCAGNAWALPCILFTWCPHHATSLGALIMPRSGEGLLVFGSK
mgnify:CR=1 FL=1